MCGRRSLICYEEVVVNPSSAWKVAEEAASVLAPEADLVESVDIADFGRSVMSSLGEAAAQPAAIAAAVGKFGTSLALLPWVSSQLLMGRQVTPPVDVDAKDRRFADPSWQDNPAFFTIRQSYLATRRLADELLAAGVSDPAAAAKAELAVGLLFDAIAPTNFLPTNPAALKRAFETGGISVAAGVRNFVDDLLHNGGRPRQVDRSPFTLGQNLAATPGKVVFRNELMELIQYSPQTEQVRAVPLLASPPWINKYYVMDLAPGRSFIEWAIKHQHTVFAISYRNPDASMRDVRLDDYLIHGPRTALDVICDITGSETVDIVGLCLGGALTAMLAAYLAGSGDNRIGSVTLLNTLLDYAEPGPLGVFTDEQTVTRLEKRMARTGFLDAANMATTFDLLRVNDLVFSYVVSNWLMGQQPPAFDILAWNADSTRMPAAMHSFYLRSLYLNNELARGELELAGRELRLSDVTGDAYIVGAINDHIVPWHASYRATELLGGDVRYVLSSGGHIAGIVNPPSSTAWYEVSDHNPPTGEQWRREATKQAGSWWQDWAAWAAQRAGALREPPPLGSERYPVLGAAPGDYVRG